MKFNEKLIQLRKKKGLSQEELGYKLNVTRQTVSKWELGQTTPEMDKLVELSKIYGVTIDELTNEEETETVEDVIKETKSTSVNNNDNKINIMVILLVVLIIIAVVLGVKKINEKRTQDKKVEDSVLNIFNEAVDSIKGNKEELDKTKGKADDIYDTAQGIIKGTIDDMEKDKDKEDVDSFNGTFETLYNGETYGMVVKQAIDKVVTNNKKNKDNIITVIYQGKSITEPTEIQGIKSNFIDMNNYDISYEYNEQGYIYQMNILDL